MPSLTRAMLFGLASLTLLLTSGCWFSKHSGGGATIGQETVPHPTTAPAVPTSLTAYPENQKILLEWPPVAGATSYQVYWDTSKSVSRSSHVISTTQTSMTHSGLANSTRYYYAVSAVDANGNESNLSDIVGSRASAFITIPQNLPSFTDLTGNPTAIYGDGNTLYIGTVSGLAVSQDGGKTFRSVTSAQGLPSNSITAITENNGQLYVATDNGVGVSDDGGQTFLSAILHDANVAIDFTTNGIAVTQKAILVTTNYGLYISTDNGATFISSSAFSGATAPSVDSVASDGNKFFLATSTGLEVSTDGGTTFSAIASVSEPSSDPFGKRFVYVTGSQVYYGNGLGLWRSVDDGVTFAQVSASGVTDSCSASSNCDFSEITGTPDSLYVLASGDYLYMSHDGGATFAHIATGTVVAQLIGNDLYDANLGGYLFVTSDGGANFTTLASTPFPGSGKINSLLVNGDSILFSNGEIFSSTDGGADFASVAGIPSTDSVKSLVVSGSTLYVGTSGGLFLSSDGGNSFTRTCTNPVMSIAVSGSHVYLGSSTSIYYSTDGGQTCTQSTSTFTGINQIAVIGSDVVALSGYNLILSTDGGHTFTQQPHGENLGLAVSGSALYLPGIGLYTSNDEGATVTPNSALSGVDVDSVLLSASGMFVGGYLSGLYQSMDNGTSFTHYSVLDGLSDNKVGTVATSGNKVYVGTAAGLSVTAP